MVTVEMAATDDLNIYGPQTERRSRELLIVDFQMLKDRERDLASVIRYSDLRGELPDDATLQEIGHIYGQLGELTRRMIVRGREDRYDFAAKNFVAALTGEEVPSLMLIFLMSGRLEDAARAVIDEPDLTKYAHAREFASAVIETHAAMSQPAWPNPVLEEKQRKREQRATEARRRK